MNKLSAKIYVAGHNGLVGSAIVRELKRDGYKNVIIADKKKLDLTNQKNTLKLLMEVGHKFCKKYDTIIRHGE